MLSSIRTSNADIPMCAAPLPDNRWNRNMKDDMKTAIDLLWKFKEELEKLHPECTHVLERLLANPNRPY